MCDETHRPAKIKLCNTHFVYQLLLPYEATVCLPHIMHSRKVTGLLRNEISPVLPLCDVRKATASASTLAEEPPSATT